MRNFALIAFAGLVACSNPTERPYRIPYADGVAVTITADDDDHTTPVADMFDMRAANPGQVLAAAAPGWVREIEDSGNSNSSTNNYVWIEHPLEYCQPPGSVTTQPPPTSECETCPSGVGKCNEWSLYAHMQQNSVRGFAGLSEGNWVDEGQPIGIEGDVGFTPCGNNNSGPNCGRHVHFTVFTIDRTMLAAQSSPTANGDYEDWADFQVQFGSGARPERVPLFCTADGLRLVRTGETYTAGPCPQT